MRKLLGLGLLVLSGCSGEPACLGTGEACAVAEDSRCNGTMCVVETKKTGTPTHCAKICLGASQCSSGCCVVLDGRNAAVCAPAEYCQ